MSGHACPKYVRVRIRRFRTCPCPKSWLCPCPCPIPCPKSQKPCDRSRVCVRLSLLNKSSVAITINSSNCFLCVYNEFIRWAQHVSKISHDSQVWNENVGKYMRNDDFHVFGNFGNFRLLDTLEHSFHSMATDWTWIPWKFYTNYSCITYTALLMQHKSYI